METRLTSLDQLMPLATAGELLAGQEGRALVTILPDIGCDLAARLMQEHEIGFLPVVRDGALLGVVAERDLVRGMHLERPASVEELMNTRVHTVGPDATVRECLTIMHQERIRHLPVVSDGVLRGVVSVLDLMGSLIERHERLLRRLADERITLLYPSSSY